MPESRSAPPGGSRSPQGGGGGGGSRFAAVNTTQAAEDAVDISKLRNLAKPSGIFASVAHIVKGALGAGVLSLHSAYKNSGINLGLPIHIGVGIFLTWCLFILVRTAYILSLRTNIGVLTYPDVGEASFVNAPWEAVRRCAKIFRYFIDGVIMIDLFGSCCCYQIIMSKSLKQLVEDNESDDMKATVPGYPDLRIYLLVMMFPFILICLIRYLKYLAPFSTVGNGIIFSIIIMTIYYAFALNKGGMTDGCVLVGDLVNVFVFVGMITFSMSCAGIVLDVSANMKVPKLYPVVIVIGMSLNIFATCAAGIFGYMAFKDKSAPPITNNFPMSSFTKFLRLSVGIMIYVTHALNFFIPFTLAFHYIKKKLKPENVVRYEYIYRALFVALCSIVAIVFPSINALMGFLGCFCLSNMAFIWPCSLELLVIWERPGLGPYKWKLWRNIFLILIGCVIWSAGTVVSFKELVESMGI